MITLIELSVSAILTICALLVAIPIMVYLLAKFAGDGQIDNGEMDDYDY